jgi:hypothetical protein
MKTTLLRSFSLELRGRANSTICRSSVGDWVGQKGQAYLTTLWRNKLQIISNCNCSFMREIETWIIHEGN